jgi:hypothetical protein
MSKKKLETVESNEIQTTKVKKLGFIKEFGRIFSEFGSQGKSVVQEKMLELFPQKSETIEKWTEWYKAYYNMGKIQGYNPDEDQKIHWKKVSE